MTTETIQDIDWIQDLITTEREAKLFIARLLREGMLWHFDDDPHDLCCEWPVETADVLEDRQNECWELLADPHEHFPVSPDVGVIHECIADGSKWQVERYESDYERGVFLAAVGWGELSGVAISNETLRQEFILA